MLWCSPLLAALLTLLSGALLFALLGHPPLETLKVLLVDPLGDLYGVSELLVKALPILLCALGLAVVYNARIWNIGAEGQLLIGALAGSALAVNIIDWDSRWALVLTLLLGTLGGAACRALRLAEDGVQRQRNPHQHHAQLHRAEPAAVRRAWPAERPGRLQLPESAMFGDATRLPELIEGLRVHAGFYFALLALVVVWVLLQKSFLGFQIKVLGLDRRAAGFVGFRDKKLVWIALLISGGLAGLAGVAEVTGPIGQLVPQVSPGYGYAAITVAFLGRLNPIGIVFASLLMALLYLGGENAQMAANLPQSITQLFQGMVLFFLLACDVLILYRPRLKLWARKPQLVSAKEEPAT